MAAPPGRASSRQPTTSTPLPTILQRFVKANQDLARHNAKLRQDLHEVRRRVDLAASAEAQAHIITALFRKQSEEASREKRELLTRLRAANDEIIKLKIQIDAQTSLRSLQRTLDAPLDPPPRSIPTPPSAASVAVGSPRPECSTSPASSPRSSTPTDAHLPSPESWSLRTPSAMTRREAWEFLGSSPEASARPPTPSPPRGFLPSPSGPMGFAAAACLTPSPELSASRTPIPARTLRARPESVCYTEPSLKTKMRRPWSPPKPTRRRSTKPTPTPTTESTRERRETVGTAFAEAAASPEKEARTPLAFVTSRRHRRRVRIVESSSSECEESDAREAEDDAFDLASASPAKPSPFPGIPSLDHYRSGHGISREVHADDTKERRASLVRSWFGVDAVGDARGGSDADDERERTGPGDSVDDFDETRTRTLPRELAALGADEETIVARRRRSLSIPIDYKEPSVNRKMRRPRTPPRR